MSYDDYYKQNPPKRNGKIKPKKVRWKDKELAFDLSPDVPPHQECVRCKRMIPKSKLNYGLRATCSVFVDFQTKKVPVCKDGKDCQKHIKKSEDANRNKKAKSSKKRS